MTLVVHSLAFADDHYKVSFLFHIIMLRSFFYVSSSDSGADGFLYIQMELCEGETLREWINERNSDPKKCLERRQEAAKIIKQVLQAVKYVHSKKLFHRDLKVDHSLK